MLLVIKYNIEQLCPQQVMQHNHIWNFTLKLSKWIKNINVFRWWKLYIIIVAINVFGIKRPTVPNKTNDSSTMANTTSTLFLDALSINATFIWWPHARRNAFVAIISLSRTNCLRRKKMDKWRPDRRNYEKKVCHKKKKPTNFANKTTIRLYDHMISRLWSNVVIRNFCFNFSRAWMTIRTGSYNIKIQTLNTSRVKIKKQNWKLYCGNNTVKR